ncbi:MBL fold metallo-hydrolase [Williamsia sterculiae]|uniref:Glyoxylase, beta-lactamase superfamily II n=1 Tax=Williamsia sterculiae TaxID=1344003 RepID=A0A1N7HBQ3_9NOCA|nr:MBL fold metallo-hydrolase [Williamsia sterculiae]SIS22108.1 Glyoxylase, beta-lactamase superfamily II [Williamsia sterculiae]
MTTTHIDTVAHPGGAAHLVSTYATNWILLQDDAGITLIDAGYPGNARDVTDSVRAIGGQMSDIRAGLLTHAHVDHIGGMAVLAGEHGFEVLTGADEVAHARREHLQQATPPDIAAMIARRPSALGWLSRVLRLGVLSRRGIDDVRAFTDDELARLPGAPVAVRSPGHTDGHVAYLVAGGRVLVTGDSLITAHPTVSTVGPQLISRTFDHDPARTRLSVETFTGLDADVIFPGHGPIHHGPVRDAARAALDRR